MEPFPGESTGLPASARALPRVRLEVVQGETNQLERAVTGPAFLIGAAADCDLVLLDPTLPPVHCYLFRVEGGCHVRTLGFEPVLRVNGVAVETQRIQEGDLLQLGTYVFRVRLSEVNPAGTLRPHFPGDPELEAAYWRTRYEDGRRVVLGLVQEIEQVLSLSGKRKRLAMPRKILDSAKKMVADLPAIEARRREQASDASGEAVAPLACKSVAAGAGTTPTAEDKGPASVSTSSPQNATASASMQATQLAEAPVAAKPEAERSGTFSPTRRPVVEARQNPDLRLLRTDPVPVPDGTLGKAPKFLSLRTSQRPVGQKQLPKLRILAAAEPTAAVAPPTDAPPSGQ